MNDALYHYIDPSFSHLQVGKYTLLLLLDPAHFSLAVMQGQQLMVWRKDAALNELTQPGEVQEVLGFAYHDVVLGIRSESFTLISQPVFEEDGVTDLARFLDVHATDTVLAQPLDANNQVIFKISEQVANAAERFGMQKVLFGANGWLHAIAANHPSAYHLYINVYDTTFDIAYFKQGKLHLFNTFEFSHEDELAYYAAFVSQQLQLDMSAITAILSGNIATDDHKYHDLLSDLFKAVELNDAVVATIPAILPKHQLLALTALPLCASLADA